MHSLIVRTDISITRDGFLLPFHNQVVSWLGLRPCYVLYVRVRVIYYMYMYVLYTICTCTCYYILYTSSHMTGWLVIIAHCSTDTSRQSRWLTDPIGIRYCIRLTSDLSNRWQPWQFTTSRLPEVSGITKCQIDAPQPPVSLLRLYLNFHSPSLKWNGLLMQKRTVFVSYMLWHP